MEGFLTPYIKTTEDNHLFLKEDAIAEEQTWRTTYPRLWLIVDAMINSIQSNDDPITSFV